jgi:hypothetical protein
MTSSVVLDARPTLEQVLGILQVHLPALEQSLRKILSG